MRASLLGPAAALLVLYGCASNTGSPSSAVTGGLPGGNDTTTPAGGSSGSGSTGPTPAPAPGSSSGSGDITTGSIAEGSGSVSSAPASAGTTDPSISSGSFSASGAASSGSTAASSGAATSGAAVAASGAAPSGSATSGAPIEAPDAAPAASPDAAPPSPAPPPVQPPPAPPSPTAAAADVLTAGTWDDNLNFPFFTKYLAMHPQLPGDPGFSLVDYTASQAQFAQGVKRNVLDVAIVLDTTGSMADEINYLKAELGTISTAVAAEFPNADQRWALVVYRDTPDSDPGDEYIVRSFDFTRDMQAFSSTVAQQNAAGGGDLPESPEIGLESSVALSWRTDPTVAKLAFWVADAPQHDYRATQMHQAISDVHAAGVHVYPVSGSGADTLLEYTMRTTAEITGGRYLFLTDDSGVGGPHKIPEIPCYFVTKLRSALVRAIASELSGAVIQPNPAEVIRISGNPSLDGTCLTEDGQTVHVF